MATTGKVVGMSVPEVFEAFRTGPGGLTREEAARRLTEFGPNRVAGVRSRARWRRFVAQFTHLFAGILWVAALLAFLAEGYEPGAGMATLGWAIALVVIVNGVFSYVQEERAERAFGALERLLPDEVSVLRGGDVEVVPARSVVPGDVLVLTAGCRIPADGRLVAAVDARMDLSTLTGESVPVWRDAAPSVATEAALATNMVLAGTMLLAGRAQAVVTATGMHTEFAAIAALAQAQPEVPSPLQREVRHLSRVIAVASLAMGASFSMLGWWLGLPLASVLLFAIGIVVANVPEGLLPQTTLSLAMASQRMARRQVLVRHLPAVEALGRASVICTDKTGTLTENRMSVRVVVLDGRAIDAADAETLGEAARRDPRLFETLLHCENLHESIERGRAVVRGEPMEIALRDLGRAVLRRPEWQPREHEIPFDPERRRLTTFHRTSRGHRVYVKGALEAVLPQADVEATAEGDVPLDDARRQQWRDVEARLGREGLRVLAVAARDHDGEVERSRLEENLVLLGLVALADPPRPEVPEAIRRCKEAGIRVIMLTGDHPGTALALARRIGLASDACRVITGTDLDHMRDARLQLALDGEVLFARVRAEQKHRIVLALRRKQAIVAVTGDGVNDAPALRAADVGIAMGRGGTDVAREAADVVLLDDNFASIVAGVEEGRAVYANIRKFLAYVLASNVPELVPYLAFVILRVPLPLTILQILAVDLGTDILPALGLGAEPPDPAVMRRPPRPRKERLLSSDLLARTYLCLGPSEVLASMGAYAAVLALGGWTWGSPIEGTPLHRSATTACFAGIVAMQVVNVLCCRSERLAAWSTPWRPNRLLVAGLAAEVLLVVVAVHAPAGQAILGTAPFPPLIGLMFVPFAVLHVVVDAAWKRGRGTVSARAGRAPRSGPRGGVSVDGKVG